MVRLSYYIEKMESKYKEIRLKWEKIQKKIDEENTSYQKIKWNEYSNEGRKNRNEEHSQKLKSYYSELEAIRNEFAKETEKIRTDSDKVFNRNYQYTVKDVDPNGLAILQNGNLRLRELVALAEEYKTQGNYTMFFMVCDKMEQTKSNTLFSPEEEKIANVCLSEANRQRNIRTDHDLIEGFEELCLAGLRDDSILANGVHNLHDELYSQHFSGADEIYSKNGSPWD